MRKIVAFTFLSLNGFYKDDTGNTGWHVHGEEENKYSEEQVQSGNILMFGRITYEMMNSFWPTEMASQLFPIVAEGMNKAEKIVFSNTLQTADWQNTNVFKGNITEQIARLKKTEGKDMAILGSGSIVSLFSDAGLIDEYQIMIDPVALGSGTPLFKGIQKKLELRLKEIRTFKSGVVLLTYMK